ncbi:AzlC family ABC transporter permease [Pollutimonas nitritireducens]|uniref:AzlC family ABC transporter permease n=1 Tax=Pollutimonas nitritireducens TaxID=2045209 RepID=UPI000C7956BF|nr:AzlC family ABC transporter permease [Pollutimonas nitritireducens]
MKSAFFRGLFDSLSIAVGYVPVAISFGLSAVYADIAPWIAVLISVLVYAGASQFILVSLVASGSGALSVVGIVLLMNLRHCFYGPVLMSRFNDAPRQLPVFVMAAGLTDEVFATAISKLDRQPAPEREHWYVGLQLGAYLSWVGGTAIGAFFGHDMLQGSPLLAQTAGFVLPALFFALLLEIRQLVPHLLLAGAALATVGASLVLPPYGAVIVGMLTGSLLGLRRRIGAK